MTTGAAHFPERLDPRSAAPFMADLGFRVETDLPARPGDAHLAVALRDRPSLRHFDPERVDFWVDAGRKGAPRTLGFGAHWPLATAFSWGAIRIVDRLDVSNEYLSFGGRLEADLVDGVAILVFTSPAPLLRRGGHSQGWDEGAENLGAFFGRLMVAIDFTPGFEARLVETDPVTRYAAFLADLTGRYRHGPGLTATHPDLWYLIASEARRLTAEHPLEWAAGAQLLDAATTPPAGAAAAPPTADREVGPSRTGRG